MRWLLIGDDFRFGARRAGDFALLQEASAKHGFGLEAMHTVAQEGVRVSSSAVRAALAAGRLDEAEALLGRPYSISGRVVHGDKLGRTIGYPTANVQLRHNRPPLYGIFAVRTLDGYGNTRYGAASLGLRPTVDNSGRAKLEVHLFDFAAESAHRPGLRNGQGLSFCERARLSAASHLPKTKLTYKDCRNEKWLITRTR
jgi:riboflavin kinase/FMN adenylyltransferase